MKKSIYLTTILAVLAFGPAAFAQDEAGQSEKAEKAESAGNERPDRPPRPDRPRGPRGPGMPRPEPPKFEDLDADASGDVTQEELTAHMVKQVEERAAVIFGRMDRNGDGKVTEDEMPAMRGRRGEGPRPPRPDRPRGDRPREEGATPKRPEADAAS